MAEKTALSLAPRLPSPPVGRNHLLAGIAPEDFALLAPAPG